METGDPTDLTSAHTLSQVCEPLVRLIKHLHPVNRAPLFVTRHHQEGYFIHYFLK